MKRLLAVSLALCLSFPATAQAADSAQPKLRLMRLAELAQQQPLRMTRAPKDVIAARCLYYRCASKADCCDEAPSCVCSSSECQCR